MANFTLEVTHPSSSDTAVQRHLRQYPGIPYNVRLGVIGGLYPFTFVLLQAPSGMTIDQHTGEITWSNPITSGSPFTIQVEVTDFELTVVTVSWSLTVTTANFLFLDAVNGNNANAGTLASPKQTINGFYLSSSGNSTYAGYFVYFRAGTYLFTGVPESGGGTPRPGLQITMGTNKPTVWLAYPGDAMPVIDFDYDGGAGSGPRFVQIDDPYVDGFRFTNSINHFFRGLSSYGVFRRCVFDALGPGADGSNSSALMGVFTNSQSVFNDNVLIQDCTFENIDTACAMKIYSLRRLLVEDCLIRNLFGTPTEGIALKGGTIPRPTVRHNTLHNVVIKAIGGNMHTVQDAEICFNLLRDNGSTKDLDLNEDGAIVTSTYIYRNTIVGRVLVQHVNSVAGPFLFANNVIVNEQSGTPPGSHIEHNDVTDPTRVIISASPNGNLVGNAADGIVDADGNLQGAYLAFFGTKGYQVDLGEDAAGERTPERGSATFAGAAPRMDTGLYPSTP